MKKHKIITLALALTLCAGLLTVPAGAYDMGKVGEPNLISTGGYHTAAIDENGTLWVWGRWVVDDDTEDSSVPVKVMDNVASVSYGSFCIAAIDTDGALWMFGNNGNGELGNGTREQSAVPIKVMDNVAAVSCGWEHTAAIQTDGSLWVWGSNSYGQIGNDGGSNDEYYMEITDSTYICQTVPVKVMDNVIAVSCGGDFTAAIQADGTLWTWGRNSSGQLGSGGEGDVENSWGTLIHTVPVKVMDNVVAVSCGSIHTGAIQTDGSLWMWGQNRYSRLGNNKQGDSKDQDGWPIQTVPIKILDNVAAISCGSDHTAALKTDGTMWEWGWNGDYQLGVGDRYMAREPFMGIGNVSTISCGNAHTAAVQNDGSLWMWGSNEYGQLGFEGGDYTDRYPRQIVPRQVEGITIRKAEEPVAAIEDSTEAATDAPSTEGESGKSPEKADADAPAPKEEKEDGGFPVLPVVLGVGGVAAVAVAALLVIKKKRP